ncbi:8363_t:CDS:1, partial [Cetraspora pellucida]
DEDCNNNRNKKGTTSKSDQEYTWVRSESEEHAIKELNKIHNCYYLEVVCDRTMTTKMNY